MTWGRSLGDGWEAAAKAGRRYAITWTASPILVSIAEVAYPGGWDFDEVYRAGQGAVA